MAQYSLGSSYYFALSVSVDFADPAVLLFVDFADFFFDLYP